MRAAAKCATSAIQGRGASTLPQRNFWAGNMLDSKKTLRFALFRFAASLALVAAGHAKANLTSPLSGASQPVEIKIVSTEFKYSPAKVWVAAGRKVTLILDNSKAETEHGIIIPAFGIRLTAAAGEIVRKTAVFDQPGEYEFSCDLPGHREIGMRGVLIVGQF
jgi:plastocyanin